MQAATRIIGEIGCETRSRPIIDVARRPDSRRVAGVEGTPKPRRSDERLSGGKARSSSTGHESRGVPPGLRSTSAPATRTELSLPRCRQRQRDDVVALPFETPSLFGRGLQRLEFRPRALFIFTAIPPGSGQNPSTRSSLHAKQGVFGGAGARKRRVFAQSQQLLKKSADFV